MPAIVGWLVVVVLVGVVNVAAIPAGVSDEVFAGSMILMGLWGHAYAVLVAFCLSVEIRGSRRDLDRLFRLPAGSAIPDNFGFFRSPLLLHLKYLRSLGRGGRNSCREALADLTRASWEKKVSKIRSLATALIACGAVGTMLGFYMISLELGRVFADANADIGAAVKASIPAMATAAVSSLIGGFMGGFSMMYISSRLDAEIDSYARSIRVILEFTNFGDDEWQADNPFDAEEGSGGDAQ
jgi:hypothetical protein